MGALFPPVEGGFRDRLRPGEGHRNPEFGRFPHDYENLSFQAGMRLQGAFSQDFLSDFGQVGPFARATDYSSLKPSFPQKKDP
jgi:hypothetical protein